MILASIRARGSGFPGKGGNKHWHVLWRIWVAKNDRRKKIFKRIERKWRKAFPPQVTTNYCFLLSYPRSGNHWVRYIIESISGFATLGARDGLGPRDTTLWIDTPLRLKVRIPRTRPRAIVIKRHNIRKFDSNNSPLTLLVRQPGEAILSHTPDLVGKDSKIMEATDGFIKMCTSVDERPSKVQIVYCEEFISKDVATVRSAIEELFLGMDVEHFEEPLTVFMEHLPRHTELSLLTLERPPASPKISWDSPEVIRSMKLIDAQILRAAKNSPILQKIAAYYEL